MYGVFARFALIIGSILIFIRRQSGEANSPAFGEKPRIPKGKPQAIPTLKMPAARGWDKGQLLKWHPDWPSMPMPLVCCTHVGSTFCPMVMCWWPKPVILAESPKVFLTSL